MSARIAAAGLAVALVLGLSGCGLARGDGDAGDQALGPAAGASSAPTATAGVSDQDTSAPSTDVPASGVVIKQDDLDELGAALDDVTGTVDEVEAEMSQDPAP